MDALCGSGTTSLAAIQIGLSTYAFDNDTQAVQGTLGRCNNWEMNGPTSDKLTIEEREAIEEKRKKKQLREEAAELLHDMAADDDETTDLVTADELQEALDNVDKEAGGVHVQIDYVGGQQPGDDLAPVENANEDTSGDAGVDGTGTSTGPGDGGDATGDNAGGQAGTNTSTPGVIGGLGAAIRSAIASPQQKEGGAARDAAEENQEQQVRVAFKLLVLYFMQVHLNRTISFKCT